MAARKKSKKVAKPAPSVTVENGREVSTGRFAPGNPGGPGRPRGYDFRAIVAERVKKTGESVEDVVGELFDELRATAKGGDSAAVSAIKLVIDRLCDTDPAKVEIGAPGSFDGPPVPATADLGAGIDRLKALRDELLGDG